ncbi:50S ribosomal protein L10 [Candidatus Bathyarchaeota archaeon ex4484_40]|nr:MAG: 50S ribosomal protein L10 [Candidatus Bathyarchaeota archaeon ex4484_40]
MVQRQVLVKKAEEVKEIVNLINKYRAVGIADIHKVRAAQLQGLRKKLKGKVYMRVFKNSLVLRALSQCKNKPNIELLKDYLKGSNIFLFTNLNPFELALLLKESKVEIIAKAGDVGRGLTDQDRRRQCLDKSGHGCREEGRGNLAEVSRSSL